MKLTKEISEQILNKLNTQEFTVSDMRNSWIFTSSNFCFWLAIHKDGGYYVGGKKVEFPFWVGLKIKRKLRNLIKLYFINLRKEREIENLEHIKKYLSKCSYSLNR